MTGAATVVLDLAFNYANVIALPLLLGVGVDNGIHMVHRRRAQTAPERDLLETSTARAVLYASLTTIFSFGNLAFSSHPGTASMGRLLTIGMLAVLVCTLIVLVTDSGGPFSIWLWFTGGSFASCVIYILVMGRESK